MLVLSRHRDETIMIGDDIEITVVDIKGDKVRIGIAAPREIQVHRKEVYDAIKREMADASHVQVDDLTGADQNVKPMRRPVKAPLGHVPHGGDGNGKLNGNGNGNGSRIP